MKKFFHLYQYIAPIVFFPFSYYLWLMRFDRNHAFVLYSIMIPVITAYVIPGLGTNYTKLWAFNTKLKIGKFRPHHGFVFGTAASLFGLLCMDAGLKELSFLAVLRTAFITASVFGFWNWIYDIYAIKAGFIAVYNKPHYEGQGPEAVATDYAPAYFGMFGFCYGAAIQTGYYYFAVLGRNDLLLLLSVLFGIINLCLPTLMFALLSYMKHGYSGIRPYR